MKNVRYIKKEKGVSPVIATILMVAITVVLAATVYLMVSGLIGGGGQTPLSASLSYIASQSDANKAVLQVSMSTPTTADYTKVSVVLKQGTTTGSTKLDASGTGSITLGSATYNIQVLDLDGNGKLSTGDQIIVDGGTNSVGGLTVIISISGYGGNAQVTIPS